MSRKRTQLCATDQIELTRKYMAGDTPQSLSAVYGVHKHSVRDIVLRHGGTMRPVGGLPAYAINEKAFDIVTNESAYWAGLIMADGCIIKRPKCVCLEISLSGQDGYHLEQLRSFLAAEAPVKWSKTNGPAHWNGQPVARFITYSRPIVDALGKFGIHPRKSLNARVIGLEDNPHFWRGAIDGDGAISRAYGNVPTVSLLGSRDLVEQFAVFCISRVPLIRAKTHKAKNVYSFRIAGVFCRAILRILYPPGAVALPRKMEKAQATIGSP